MAFVNEWISEEDRAKYKIDSLSGAHVQWEADHDREYFLLCAGGVGAEIELAAHYEFMLLLGKVKFQSRAKFNKTIEPDGIRRIHWTFYSVVPHLNKVEGFDDNELRKIFTEAMQEHVLHHKKKYADVVTVSFEV
jgi:hypothetical protein